MASAVAAVALSLVPLSSRHVYVKVAFGATGKAPIVMSQRGSSTRPTHFLSFRLPNADLHAKVAEAQKMIILREPDAVGCDVEPVKSHLTLFVLSLGNHEAMQAATKALRSCASFAIDSNLLTPPRVHLEGLGNFGQRVCFVPVAESTGPDAEDLARVRRLVSYVAKVFCKSGLVDEAVVDGADAKGWTPHLTLLKTSKRPAGKGRGRGGKSGRGHASRPSHPACDVRGFAPLDGLRCARAARAPTVFDVGRRRGRLLSGAGEHQFRWAPIIIEQGGGVNGLFRHALLRFRCMT